MNEKTVCSDEPILLVGGGHCTEDQLRPLLARCPVRVAADGGAQALLDLGIVPDAVIGDLDSLTPREAAAIPPGRIHHIAEQDSTDFDKCLRNIATPLVIGAGFLGGRLDHELAALTVLARRADRRCVLLGTEDVVTLAPPRLTLDLPARMRVSLYPLGPVKGSSTGLRWPIDGLDFAPDTRTGTSNEAEGGRVELRLEAPRMLLILPAETLPVLLEALLSEPSRWPAPA